MSIAGTKGHTRVTLSRMVFRAGIGDADMDFQILRKS
jgi:hypothetical protein